MGDGWMTAGRTAAAIADHGIATRTTERRPRRNPSENKSFQSGELFYYGDAYRSDGEAER